MNWETVPPGVPTQSTGPTGEVPSAGWVSRYPSGVIMLKLVCS
jgi:hypothetical protein